MPDMEMWLAIRELDGQIMQMQLREHQLDWSYKITTAWRPLISSKEPNAVWDKAGEILKENMELMTRRFELERIRNNLVRSSQGLLPHPYQFAGDAKDDDTDSGTRSKDSIGDNAST